MEGLKIPTCEVCGERASRLVRVLIEGAELSVCVDCSRLGDPVKPKPRLRRRIAGSPSPASRRSYRRASLEEVDEGYVLVENYGLLVKRARERIGLTLRELGAKIGEKASVIAKIEGGRLKPDQTLLMKLEHFLGVRLLTKPVAVRVPRFEPKTQPGLTIGDILRMKTRGSEKKI